MPRRKPFRPFLDMIYQGIPDASLRRGAEDLAELVPGRGSPRLFLGYYTEEAIREAFQRFSIQTRLDELGLRRYRLLLDAANPDHQVLKLLLEDDPVTKGREPIAEVILRESLLTPKASLLIDPKPCAFLVIQWICLQNPVTPFDYGDLLPGQSYPGLGVGNKVLAMFHALLHRLDLEGIINRPEFLHNAIMYSKVFRFLNPQIEGRLQALKRQLAGMTLWQIAWAVQRGFIIEDNERTFFRWYQSEQIWPHNERLEAYFAGPAYLKAVKAAEDEASYVLSDAAPAEFRP